ncbi:hypothetical protein Tco_1448102 [Tanacetum coccineum]
MRLDVLKFNGADPESWIFAITEYFELLDTPATQGLKYDDPQRALSKLLRTWTVAEYQRTPSCKTYDVGRSFFIGTHYRGMFERPVVTTAVKSNDIVTGVIAEKQSAPHFSTTRHDLGKPPLLPTPTQSTANTNTKPFAIKWISRAERQECLNKGLCFNCDNK